MYPSFTSSYDICGDAINQRLLILPKYKRLVVELSSVTNRYLVLVIGSTNTSPCLISALAKAPLPIAGTLTISKTWSSGHDFNRLKSQSSSTSLSSILSFPFHERGFPGGSSGSFKTVHHLPICRSFRSFFQSILSLASRDLLYFYFCFCQISKNLLNLSFADRQ